MKPGFHAYWEEIPNEGRLLHLEYGHQHPGGEDHYIVIGERDADILKKLLWVDGEGL